MANAKNEDTLKDEDILKFLDGLQASTKVAEVDHVQKVLDGIAEQQEIVKKHIVSGDKTFAKYDWVKFVQGDFFDVKIGHFPIPINGKERTRVKGLMEVAQFLKVAEAYIKRDMHDVQRLIIETGNKRKRSKKD